MSGPARMGPAARVYRVLLLAYPPHFRKAFGENMADDFRRLCTATRGEGSPALARLWLRTAADLLWTGLKERVEARRARRESLGRRSGSVLGDLVQDLGYAVRAIRKSPSYAGVVVLTLALGIGINTAMFSLVDGVLLQPLPYAQGSRIVHLTQNQPQVDNFEMTFSVPEIEDYRSRNHTLTDVVEYHSMTFTLLGVGEPELVRTGVVSARFFEVLGMTPILGRTFTSSDDQLGASPVMILSNEYWADRFESDPGVIGRGFVMNGKVHTVIGVLPPIPQYPNDNDVYMPTSQCPTRSGDGFIANRRARMMTVFGVLRDGVELADAQADLGRLSTEIGEEFAEYYAPESTGYRTDVTPLKEELVHAARPTLLLLMGTTILVLLIACANVASLALARAVRRGPELAVRQAMGAGRGRLGRQLVTESTLLSLLGGLLGVALAKGSLGLLQAFAGRFTPRAYEATIDGRVLLFALAVSIVTGILFGSVPALKRAATEGRTLGRSHAVGGGPASHRAHAWLVGAQVATALVLLVGAGLLTRTFVAVSSVDPGYRSAHVLSAHVTLPDRYFKGMPGDVAFFDELTRRIRELPSVLDVARVQTVPLSMESLRTGLQPDGQADTGPHEWVQVMMLRASPEYLQTLEIPVLAGRALTQADEVETDVSAVLSHALAERLWPGEDPLGRKVRGCSFNDRSCSEWVTVVGVAGDVKMEGLEADATPVVYLAQTRDAFGGSTLVIRADGDLAALGRGVTSLVHEIDAEIPVSRVRALDTYVQDQVAPRKLTASLMALFAGLALVVTLAGVAGVVAFTTSRRTREIGLRLALGAEPRSVLRRVVQSGMRPALIGLGVGAAVSFALSIALSRLVWGVPAVDPISFLAATLTLGGGAALACWLPARRATRIDPTEALRSE